MSRIIKKIFRVGALFSVLFLVIAIFGLHGIKYANATSSRLGTFRVTPDVGSTALLEGSNGSVKFQVYNTQPSPADNISISVDSPCLLSPGMITISGGGSTNVSIPVTGQKGCTGGTVTFTNYFGSFGNQTDTLVVPVLVAVTPLDVPYTVLSSNATFEATPGLIAGGGSANQSGGPTITLQNISPNSITVVESFPSTLSSIGTACVGNTSGSITLASGGSKSIKLSLYFDPSCVGSQVIFSNAANVGDKITVPITITILDPNEDIDGNIIPSIPTFAFPPSFIQVNKNNPPVIVIHGDNIGGSGVYKFSSLDGTTYIASSAQSLSPAYSPAYTVITGMTLSPGTIYSYNLDSKTGIGVFVVGGGQVFDNYSGAVGFTSSSEAPSTIINSTWTIFNQTNPAVSIANFVCSGACDYLAPVLATGNYLAQLTVKNSSYLYDTLIKGFDVFNGASVSPTASSVSATEADYCFSGPAATVNWTYSDPGSNPQSAYQVQVDTNGGSFSPPITDSGKISSSGTSYFVSGLPFNTTLKARVMVWNSNGTASSWAYSNSWKTPKHAYPNVNFTWSPSNALINQPVQFTDNTQFFDGGGSRVWNWLFGDGGTSAIQNPNHTYSTVGAYSVTETVTDKDGYTCALTQPLNVAEPMPVWKEVSPK